MAITYRNINAPDFGASNRLMVQGGKSIVDAFDSVVNYGDKYQKRKLAAEALERSLVTQGLQDEALQERIAGQQNVNEAFGAQNTADLLNKQLTATGLTEQNRQSPLAFEDKLLTSKSARDIARGNLAVSRANQKSTIDNSGTIGEISAAYYKSNQGKGERKLAGQLLSKAGMDPNDVKKFIAYPKSSSGSRTSKGAKEVTALHKSTRDELYNETEKRQLDASLAEWRSEGKSNTEITRLLKKGLRVGFTLDTWNQDVK